MTVRMVIMLLLALVIVPMLPLLISQRWDWWEAWVYLVLYILSFIVSRALAARRHPDIIAERGRSLEHKDIKPWDKILAPLVGLGIGFILLIVGIEALGRPSPLFDLRLKLAALAVILAGYAWSSYALIENRFFSGVVRIQTERSHSVVSTGPYAWMRHPGYAGALWVYLVTPVWLDSVWAFLPTLLLLAALVLRTALEDKTLQAELPGYREYAQKVRYRLAPGVW